MDTENTPPWGPQGLPLQEPFDIDGRTLTATQVIEALSTYLSPERQRIINRTLKHRTYNFATITENIYDFGNISAAMRSAEAFGFYHFHIIQQENSKFKTANRVTTGAEKWLDIKKYSRPEPCIQSLKNSGYQIFATDLQAAVTISDIDFSKPTALVFGNEKDGVSNEVRDLCDASVILPMHGFTQSFNISVAASLSYQHVFNDRKNRLGLSGDLTEKEEHFLRAHYFLLATNNARKILKNIKFSK